MLQGVLHMRSLPKIFLLSFSLPPASPISFVMENSIIRRSYIFISSITDIAFVDRADIKAYVGPPTLQARYEILRSGLQELMRTGILTSLQVQY